MRSGVVLRSPSHELVIDVLKYENKRKELRFLKPKKQIMEVVIKTFLSPLNFLYFVLYILSSKFSKV